MEDLLAELGFEEEEEEEEEEIAALEHPSGRPYGWLSAEYESNGDDCAIGYDKPGGCSYGKHQFAVRTGKFAGYKKYVGENYPKSGQPELHAKYVDVFSTELINEAKNSNSKSECLSNGLTAAFNKVCNDETFMALAHNTIIEQNYKPVYTKLLNSFGGTALFSNMGVNDEEALKEMCYSIGVQHGKAYNIFLMALKGDCKGCEWDEQSYIFDPESCNTIKSSGFPSSANSTLIANANTISMSEFVDRVYAARGIYLNVCCGFTSKDKNNLIVSRAKNEMKKLKDQLY